MQNFPVLKIISFNMEKIFYVSDSCLNMIDSSLKCAYRRGNPVQNFFYECCYKVILLCIPKFETGNFVWCYLNRGSV